MAALAIVSASTAKETDSPAVNRRPKPAAGENGPMMVDPEKRLRAIDRAVGGLTDEQKGKIREILVGTRQQLQSLREESRDAVREKGPSIIEASRVQISAILTDEQKVKFDEAKEKRPGVGRRHKPNKPD